MGPCGPQGTIRTRMDTYGHQMLPRALLEMNVLRMPHQMLPRCLPDASKSFPDASSDASQMPPRALLEMNAQGRTKIYITPHMTHKCKAKKFLGPRCNRTVALALLLPCSCVALALDAPCPGRSVPIPGISPSVLASRTLQHP